MQEKGDKMSKILFIVVPCYNEEVVLEETAKQLLEKLTSLVKEKKVSEKSRVLLVDDGSEDNTWQVIRGICKREKFFTGISLSRNVGHQNALLAGLMTARRYADVVISMDADLQDDVQVIDAMLAKNEEGCEIVYGVRSGRKSDSLPKRMSAEGFYKMMRLIGVNIVYNHADFRLTSKRALDHLAEFGEINLFLRGIFPLIGLKSGTVEYERRERAAGTTKYPLKKMCNFAWDGITSFSIKPIRLVLALGLLIFLISFVMITYFVIVKLLGRAVEGWTFIVTSIWLLGGLQMLALGIVGEYIGKIYNETKRRPRYIIAENLLED